MKTLRNKLINTLLKALGHNTVVQKGVWTIVHRSADGEVISVDDNIVPNEGLNLINNVFFGSTSKPTLYGLLTKNNYTPVAADTLASFLASAVEATGYSESVRQTYVPVVSGVGVTNTAAKMTFSINATDTIRGVALCTNAVKGSNTGIGVSFLLLSTPKNVSSGDSLTLEYNFTSTSA